MSSDALASAAPQPAPVLRYLIGWIAVPLFALALYFGGVWLIAGPVLFYAIPIALDFLLPSASVKYVSRRDAAPLRLDRYRLILLVWPFVQAALLAAAIYATCVRGHLSTLETFALFFFAGQITSTIGIVYAHELMHSKSRVEIFMADVLMAMTLYSHFRTEHLLVHHRYVGTPRDTVTARFGETLYQFYARVLPGSLASAWDVEAKRLRYRGLPVWHASNPFWRYVGLQAACAALVWMIGGWSGLLWFIYLALIAQLVLEAINYIEHYGLFRAETAPGRYESIALHHSWDSNHPFTSYQLINLTRHPDHHYRPDHPYQYLSSYRANTAPQMPFSYPIMMASAFVPSIWRRVTHRRIERWRERHGYLERSAPGAGAHGAGDAKST